MAVATGLAPAKLNLFLHILGRRPDGYHDLQTVFEFVDLCDEVRVETTADGHIERSPPPSDPLLAGLTDNQDLTVRAARLLQGQCKGEAPGARIHVTKRIPAGGGLGGGSSDAATTLRLLNRLWKLDLPLHELAALGGDLGADVPVFVWGRSAWAEGRGERLTPVELPPAWYVIVDPGVAVSTAAVFAHPELTRDSPPLTMRDLGTAPTRNDCEPVVRAAYPAVAAALDDLGRHAEARLTGTGGCVFAKFRTEAEARNVAGQLAAARSVFVVRSLPTVDR